ncbi:MAG: flagellar basal body P-ring formation chaperone FlgA [Caldimicrobium sp.]|nr:flagellar basal body P-ring formation chaperone FlgA [Caldimicrobium sp.]MCX7613885.1 flagellar basal body P-ring formation chaperone FlgA [Caldimicrobium sp.]MDW8183435.1 flagellar basal body P-ring formation chaperone FlgA [Caldimicrobium sp.]
MKSLLSLLAIIFLLFNFAWANYYDERDFKEIFLAEFKSRYKDQVGEIQLERFRVEATASVIPRGTPYKIEWIGNAKAGSNSAILIFRMKSAEEKIVRLWGYVEIRVPVVILKNNLASKTILTEDDLILESRELSRLPQDVIFRVEEVFGKELRMSLKAGTVLRNSHLNSPTVIRRNQEVEIIAKSKNLLVKAKGIALQNGKIEDLIRVKNLSSQKVIQAKVVADGIVEVSF